MHPSRQPTHVAAPPDTTITRSPLDMMIVLSNPGMTCALLAACVARIHEMGVTLTLGTRGARSDQARSRYVHAAHSILPMPGESTAVRMLWSPTCMLTEYTDSGLVDTAAWRVQGAERQSITHVADDREYWTVGASHTRTRWHTHTHAQAHSDA